MELTKLEKYKREFKSFSSYIASLQSYLQGSVTRTTDIINPAKVSQALNIPELDIIFLLSLAEKEHLVKKILFVYNENHDFLGEYNNLNAIPHEILDENTGKEVNEDDFIVDLVFQPLL